MLVYQDIPEEFRDYDNAQVVVVPVPYEKTTTYGKGTSKGPEAICNASFQVELYDEELDAEPYLKGIHTVKQIKSSLEEVESVVSKIAKDKKIPILLGGEHTISAAPVRALKKIYPNLSVVQFDAHADLRDTYEKTPLSHACVMRRIYETGVPFVQIGIRSHSPEEAKFIKQKNLKLFYAHKIHDSLEWMDAAINKLSNEVYLTFDVDAFDPCFIPATGTPEPGGLDWYKVTKFLKKLAESKKIVGADFVELAPREGDNTSDFIIARLIYKFIGYLT